MNLLFVVGF